MSRKLVALCGAPSAGKSLVAGILSATWNVQPVDDGEPLRDFAVRHFGLTRYQVYTQEGKAETVVLFGKRMTVRGVLGQIGNSLEAVFGPNVLAEMALLKCQDSRAYSFGSVRRQQASVFKRHGGIVVAITKPGCEVVNEFDQYDGSLVDFVIPNDADYETLKGRVLHAVSPYLHKP